MTKHKDEIERLFLISSMIDKTDGQSNYSLSKRAKDLNISSTTVRKVVHKLYEAGLLNRKETPKKIIYTKADNYDTFHKAVTFLHLLLN